jgi:hypothetical protein
MAVRLSRRDASCRPVTTHPGLHHRTSLKGHLQGSIIPRAARGVFPNPPYTLVSKLRWSFDGTEGSKSWNCGALIQALLSPNSNPHPFSYQLPSHHITTHTIARQSLHDHFARTRTNSGARFYSVEERKGRISESLYPTT